MKKLMLSLVMLLAACAPAQTVTTAKAATAQSLPPQVFPAGYDAAEACQSVHLWTSGHLAYTLPARFPKPAQNGFISNTYTLTCPTFTIVNRGGNTLRIVGLDYAGLKRLSLYESNSPTTPNFFAIFGGAYLDLSQSGVVTLAIPQGAELRPESVVAIRQNGGPLQQVAFNGVLTPLTFDPKQPVEIYMGQRASSEWSAAVWNEAEKSLDIDYNAKFPEK